MHINLISPGSHDINSCSKKSKIRYGNSLLFCKGGQLRHNLLIINKKTKLLK